MKNILHTLIALILMTVLVDARHNLSEVNISDETGQKIIVYVDGEEVNHYPQRNVRIDLVRPGFRQIEVVTIERRHHRRGFREVVLFNSTVLIEGSAIIHAIIDHHNQFRIKRIHTGYKQRSRHKSRNNAHSHQNKRGNKHGYGKGKRKGKKHKRGFRNRLLSEHELMVIQRKMDRANFEDRKFGILELNLAGRQITAFQLGTLMANFRFDSKRLDVAMAFFPMVVDPQNDFEILDQLKFRSSRAKFKRYFNSAR